MTFMPLIAYTKIGNNCLVAGLITHAAALIVGMMTAAGAEAFFSITYIFAWVFLVSGSFAKLRHRVVRPFKTRRFYLTAMAAVFPVLGPLVVLGLIYNCSEDGRAGRPAGFFPIVMAIAGKRADGFCPAGSASPVICFFIGWKGPLLPEASSDKDGKRFRANGTVHQNGRQFCRMPGRNFEFDAVG